VNDLSVGTIVFYLIAGVTIVSAAGVAFSRNIFYSAVFLLGALAGIAGLYGVLAADFLLAVQILVYIGGILVITIFAVMLTHRIADVRVSNRSVGRLPALLIVAGVFLIMARAVGRTTWNVVEEREIGYTTYAVGDAFLGAWVLPFELASLVLLAALIGAIVLSRKELR
jgi:NAD(P)H-quinone oxidoreductase subunit 6